MNQAETRSFKIDKIIKKSNSLKKLKKYEIRCWKVKEDIEISYPLNKKFKYKRGTLFIQLESGLIFRVNNTTDSTNFGDAFQLKNNLIPNGHVIEVEINDEKWSHPHLLKELKNRFIST